MRGHELRQEALWVACSAGLAEWDCARAEVGVYPAAAGVVNARCAAAIDSMLRLFTVAQCSCSGCAVGGDVPCAYQSRITDSQAAQLAEDAFSHYLPKLLDMRKMTDSELAAEAAKPDRIETRYAERLIEERNAKAA